MHQSVKKAKAVQRLRGDVGVIVAEFNAEVTEKLLAGARRALSDATVPARRVRVYHVAGSFEVAELAMRLAKTKRFAALVCLGVIMKGETTHDQHLASAVTDSLLRVSLDTGVSVGLGVITVNNLAQAKARSGSDRSNRGYSAAAAALGLVAIKV